jgi:hypothetical protein
MIGPTLRWLRKEVGSDNPLYVDISIYWCHWCFFEFDWYEDPWLEVTASGNHYSEDGTVYWFRGVQQCPRCRRKWEVSDSS